MLRLGCFNRWRLCRRFSSVAHEPPKPRAEGKRSVISWGSGVCGTRGDATYDAAPNPSPVPAFEGVDVAEVKCGWGDCLVRTECNDLYRWGWAHDFRTIISVHLLLRRLPRVLRFLQRMNLGWLGFQSGDPEPRLVEPLGGKCAAMSSGAGFSNAVSTNGELLSWGDGFYGQLGHGPSTYLNQASVVPKFNDMEKPPKIVQTASGTTHALALAEDGEVYSFGRLDCGAIGIGNVSDHFGDILQLATRPQSIRSWYNRLDRTGNETVSDVVKVAAGRNISAFLTRDGKLWTCGKNGSGALGLGHFLTRSFPTLVDAFDGEAVIDVACGHYHMVAVTESHRVFSWGIGNHGQCGRPPRSGVANPESKANQSVLFPDKVMSFMPGQIPLIPTEAKVSRVEAGAHHSAFITERGECIVVGGDCHNADAFLPKLPFADSKLHSISFGLSHGLAICSPLPDGDRSLDSLMEFSNEPAFCYLANDQK